MLLRGGRLITGDGTQCYEIGPVDPGGLPAIRPDQPTRFLLGWLTDFDMTPDAAEAHFASFTATAHWDETGSAQLLQHEIIASNEVDLPSYVCSFTAP